MREPITTAAVRKNRFSAQVLGPIIEAVSHCGGNCCEGYPNSECVCPLSGRTIDESRCGIESAAALEGNVGHHDCAMISISRSERPMTPEQANTHERAIRDQFSRQAAGFAVAPELHADGIVALVVEAAKPQAVDRAIDLACGPGTVACALAQRVQHVVGLDSTVPMLEQARGLARRQNVNNVEWRAGDVYQTPYADGSFNIVTCRFAFHHFEKPALAFAEMIRLVASGGRVVVCDGLASEEAAKAEAFNAMERRRDPSTVEFRTLPYLRGLFEAAGLGDPQVQRFDVSYLASDLVARSFPVDNDRAGLLAMIESTVAGDKMDVGAHWTPEGVRFAFRSAVLSAVKPG